MFFLLRCAFWLTLVAVALPWAGGGDGDYVAPRVRSSARTAAVPAAPAPPPSECASSLESCLRSVAPVDLIAMALEDQTGSIAPRKAVQSPGIAVRRRFVPSRQVIDPIATELLRGGARN